MSESNECLYIYIECAGYMLLQYPLKRIERYGDVVRFRTFIYVLDRLKKWI